MYLHIYIMKNKLHFETRKRRLESDKAAYEAQLKASKNSQEAASLQARVDEIGLLIGDVCCVLELINQTNERIKQNEARVIEKKKKGGRGRTRAKKKEDKGGTRLFQL